MKKISFVILVFILLIILSSCSREKDFRNIIWGMTISEVKNAETLKLEPPKEGGKLKVLEYKYTSTFSEDSYVMYMFLEESNYTLSSGGYWYYIDQAEKRKSLIETIKSEKSEIYGNGKKFENSNFSGYIWEFDGTVLSVFDDIGAEAVVEIYLDKEYINTLAEITGRK
ncbi:hypothetical protein EJP82_06660 [Paenibacillus anaericanus]|uniref:Uncharacterized protein n=1 Tax=Paenibacillus anaericanus TaxID=170367 RepID=A0A3S1DXG1_9BACL|nr:hypothetical protein [Paenibacillus anaericanus]RUT47386.1 hypothetical protein EJP82_06660 [Paenibacillus anaericanus]